MKNLLCLDAKSNHRAAACKQVVEVHAAGVICYPFQFAASMKPC